VYVPSIEKTFFEQGPQGKKIPAPTRGFFCLRTR
jgi:hypothetical protein